MSGRALLLWRHDARRRAALWCLRFPGVLSSRARARTAGAALLAAAALLSLLVAVCALVVFAPPGAHRLAAGLTVLGLGQAVFALTSSLSLSDARDRLADPDSELLLPLGVDPRDLVAARVFLRDLLPLAATTGALLAPVAAAVAVVLGSPGLVARGLALVVAARLAGVFVGRLAGLATLRVAAGLPAPARGPVTLASGLLRPVVGAAVVLLGGRLVLGTHGGTGAAPQVLDRPVVRLAAGLLEDAPRTGAACAALLLLAVLALYAGRRLADGLGVGRLAQAFGEGPRWKVGSPLRSGVAGAVADKDRRLLVRRGPVLWETFSTAADLLPALAALGVGAAVAGAALPAGRAGTVGVTVLLAMSLVGYLAVVGESVAPLSSVDNDGPVLEVLRADRDAFGTYLGARAAQHAGLTYLLCCPGLACLAVGGAAVLRPADLLAIALLCGVVCLADGVALVVASARYRAVYRPSVGLPEIEPQVQAVTAAALAGSATVGGVVLLALSLLPLPGGTAGALLTLAAVPVVGALIVALARRTAPLLALRDEVLP